MLTALMAWAFLVSEPTYKSGGSLHVASPEKLGIYKLKQTTFPYTLNPQWQVARITSRTDSNSIQAGESNLEQWRNAFELVNIEELTPHTAIKKHNPDSDYGVGTSIGSAADLPNSHCPWHLAMQRYWPGYFQNNVLVYEITKTPTGQKPYYEAFVCCMPNIRCKAKTIELLEEQLLQHYASYLETLMEQSIPESGRKNEVIFGESWIAKQPARSEIKADLRILSPSSQIDYNNQPWVQFGY